MIKYLCKSTQEIRVETKEDADELHQQFEKEANENGYVLSAWTETLKERKQKGEIVESWYYCKATFVFNDQKEPVYALNHVDYNMSGSVNTEVPW